MKRTFGPILLALLAGLGLGLLYSWVISPVRYVDTTPASLRADFKDRFRTLIAAAYAASRNLDRARARLSTLGDSDPVQALSAQAQRMLAAGESFPAIQQVARLASDLQNAADVTPLASLTSPPPARPSPLPTLNTPTVITTSEPVFTAEVTNEPPLVVTSTPRPLPTPTAIAGPPFRLISQESLCDENLPEGLLQIIIQDRNRQQLAGIEIIITWLNGEDHFFTGLKPEMGNGYADFAMQSEVVYSVQIASEGAPISNIQAPSCTTPSGRPFLGSIRLIFQQ
ncbi:MAG: hypothetical protein ACP5QU_06755 [Anaerolineae bacterium]